MIVAPCPPTERPTAGQLGKDIDIAVATSSADFDVQGAPLDTHRLAPIGLV